MQGAAPAASPRSWLSRIRSARLIHFTALCLLLLFGWAGSGNAAHDPVVCQDMNGKPSNIPCKEIWFYNNSNVTLYPVLFFGGRGVDEWLQAYAQVLPAQRGTAKWETTRDSRVYINGTTGIAPKDTTHSGYAAIQMPLFTALKDTWNTGTTADSVADWWNGGRLEIFDNLQTISDQYNIDVKLTAPFGVIDPVVLGRAIPGNVFVRCVKGDCTNLKMITVNGEFDNSAPFQLTEFTFGSALTGKDFANTPFGWVPRNVGYNLSMVDSTYLTAAMEPLNNVEIPYIGSVLDPATFRDKMRLWLKAHDGYPIYKTSTLAQPKIPQSFDAFANAFLPFSDQYNTANNLNFDPNGTAGKNAGAPILDMINLYLHCINPAYTGTPAICGKIRQLKAALFDPNLTKYMTYPCAVYNANDKDHTLTKFPDTVSWRLWTLYGWVPYNFTFGKDYNNKPPTDILCGTDKSNPPFNGNALFDTPGVDQTKYQALADSYRLETGGLQYLKETTIEIIDGQKKEVTHWFNPYVELIHGKTYLDMKSYAFSIDDAIGFQSHKGEGLIYAVGGTTGLDNPNALNPGDIVNVAYGYATDGSTYLWQNSKYQCGTEAEHTVDFTQDKPSFPSFDFFPKTSGGYPCKVAATAALKDNTAVTTSKSFRITAGPPTLTIDCNLATDPTWCANIKLVSGDPKGGQLDHIIGPSVPVR